MSVAINLPVAAGLVALAAGAVGYVFVLPVFNGERRASQRLKNVSASVSAAAVRGVAISRREQVAKTLSEIDAKQKSEKVTLDLKIAQAGLTWTPKTYYIVSVGLGAIMALLLFLISGSPVAAFGGAFVGGFGLPLWILSFLRKRRIDKFIKELPTAVDVIVRGIRTGIPLGDCFRIVSREAEEPVRGEFRVMMETQAMGLSLSDCCKRLAERVPVPEVNFFSIVINIQQQSGGNLSESLNNLSKILRDRRKMSGKIKAMSMEAKASGGIIAVLPFAVAGMTYLTNPDYISLLWTTDVGKLALLGCAVWMGIGVFVMKKMIAFDF